MAKIRNTTTMQRLQQWVNWWMAPPNGTAEPGRPADVSPYHDKQLRDMGYRLASVERAREQ